MNIADLLHQLAQASPQADALVYGNRVLGYGELDRLVMRIAAGLVAAGIEPGTQVGVSLERFDPMNVALILGIARMGAVSAPLAANLPEVTRTERCRQFELSVVIAKDRRYAIEGTRFLLFEPLWKGAQGGDETPGPAFYQPNWPWRMHVSTGTLTNRRKAVLEGHDWLVHNVTSFRASGLAKAGGRFLTGLPMTVASGVRPCLRQLLTGNAVVFPRSDKPADLLQAIEQHRVTEVLLSQMAVRQLIALLPRGRTRFPGLQRVSVGGFSTPPALVEEMAARIAADVKVVYGATETNVMAVADLADLRRAEGSVGRPVPWLEMQIVDEQDRPVATGATGIVRVKGTGLPDHYFGDPESTRKVFRNGWVYPGDYGRLDDDGYLRIDSRVDDIVMVAGRRIDLPAIDKVLARHPQVADGAAFTFVSDAGETRVVAAVVAHGALEESEVLAHCQAALQAFAAPVQVMQVAALPRNEGGKVMRHELARQRKEMLDA